VSRFVRPELDASVRSNMSAHYRQVAADLGLSLTDYERRVRRHLRDLYRDADVSIRLSPSAPGSARTEANRAAVALPSTADGGRSPLTTRRSARAPAICSIHRAAKRKTGALASREVT
jgi:hypothetical protein